MYVVPLERHAGRVNRDAAFLLFGIVVGFGRALIDFARPMLGTAEIQHLFGDRRLASVDVSDDADVANFV